MESTRASLLAELDKFSSVPGQIKESTLSTLVFNDGKRIGRFRDGAEITIGQADKLLKALRNPEELEKLREIRRSKSAA